MSLAYNLIIAMCQIDSSFLFVFKRVFSYNTGRQHRGKTSYTDDPHIQTFNLPGFFEQCYIFQATFTDEQLNSTETMYKGVDRIMSKFK